MSARAHDGTRSLRDSGALAIVLLATAGVYAWTFDVPFQFDDARQIVQNERVRDLGAALRGLWEAPARSIGTLTFALNWALHRDTVAGYHLVNLLVHVFATMLVYALARLALGATRVVSSPPRGHGAALVAALLFGVHPIQTQAVTYIVQRFASLAGLLALASACAYLIAARTREQRRRIVWTLAGVAAFAAACLVKQNVVTLPFALAAAEVALLDGSFASRARRLSPYAMVALGASALLLAGTGDLSIITGQAHANSGIDGPWTYLLTQMRVIPSYLFLIFWPSGQSVDHDVVPSRSLADFQVLLGLAFLIVMTMAALAAAAGRLGRDPQWRVVGFGVLWTFAFLGVESSVLPIADLMVEHRVYLPLGGLVIAAAVSAAIAGDWLITHGAPRFVSRLPLAALAAAALPLGVATVSRNEVWRSDLTLWQDAVTKAPGKARPLNNLATALKDRGLPERAIQLYRSAIAAEPRSETAWRGLGASLAAIGDAAEAERALAEARKLRPLSASVALETGNLALAQGRVAEAVNSYREAARLEPRNAGIRHNLGGALFRTGDAAGAEREFRVALSLDAHHAPAHVGLGRILAFRGDLPGAEACFRKALAADPASADAHAELGLLAGLAGRPSEAIDHLEAAVRGGRDDAASLENLGTALFLVGRVDEALRRFLAAVEKDPKSASVRFNLSLALRAAGQTAAADQALAEARTLDPTIGKHK